MSTMRGLCLGVNITFLSIFATVLQSITFLSIFATPCYNFGYRIEILNTILKGPPLLVYISILYNCYERLQLDMNSIFLPYGTSKLYFSCSCTSILTKFLMKGSFTISNSSFPQIVLPHSLVFKFWFQK